MPRRTYRLSERMRWAREASRDRAIELLAEVSRDHNIDVKSLKHEARYQHFVDARRDFAARGMAAGISSKVLGELINRDHTSILNAANPAMRERKRKWREVRVCPAS